MILSKTKLFWLVVLRIVIGWHFLYEGMVKLFNSNWSSVGYLLDSEGWFREMFVRIASNPVLLNVIDFLNTWGLIAIGLSLILGLLTRPALIAGLIMLGFYYLSHPPFIGLKYDLPMEGSYLIVNKVLIEWVALVILWLFPTSGRIGVDRFIFKQQKTK